MWKPGSAWSGKRKAQEAGAFLMRSGPKTAKQVLALAAPKRSPLHDLFDWDDTVAARKWRLEQAGELLRSIHIKYIDAGGEGRSARAFVNLTEKGHRDAQPYYATMAVLSDKGMRKIILKRAISEADAWRQRYEQYEELAGICEAIKRQTRRRRARAG